MFKVLLTCPPMINRVSNYTDLFKKHNLDVFCPKFQQTLSEEELINLVPKYDAWIIGDDPATRKVFEAGVSNNGKLKAVIKWGVGVDNVDFQACKDLGLPVTNTPNVFGEEVSDIAIGYLISLCRQIHNIDQGTKNCQWLKPCGTSIYGKKICQIGFGDIGRTIIRKLIPFNGYLYVSDPGFENKGNDIICKFNPNLKIPKEISEKIVLTTLWEAVTDSDVIIVACNLNKSTHGLVNKELILKAKKGVKIINIARGQVVNERDVVELLDSGHIDCVGFDVFEEEPLPKDSKLRNYPRCIFGSHNSSNTMEAVDKTSHLAISKLVGFLNNVSKL